MTKEFANRIFVYLQMIGVSIPLKEHDETRLGEMNVQTDYLCAGNIIGEMGMLTRSARNASVICETTVQVCYDVM
jgi:CRP-like cAMP-binding protein